MVGGDGVLVVDGEVGLMALEREDIRKLMGDYVKDTSEHSTATDGETRVVDPVTGGAKGQKLCEMGAVDPMALAEVGKVAGYGSIKYARYNFAAGYKWSLSYDALQRHLMAFWGGEDKDPESGFYHLAHAGWHCLALLYFSMRGRGTDDRFPR